VKWLVTFREIPHSQDWLVGIVVPEAYYTRDLRELRNRFLLMILALTGIALVAEWPSRCGRSGARSRVSSTRRRACDASS
jgi:hypothetical protein